MDARLKLAANSILDAIDAIDLDADPDVNNANFNAALEPALRDMEEGNGVNVAYVVSAATGIIRDLTIQVAEIRGVPESTIISELRHPYVA